MKVGTVKEIKPYEYRVGLTPRCVKNYVQHNHEVFVEKGAGLKSGFSDDLYVGAGARILENPGDVFEAAEMIVKVKEPIEEEYQRLKPFQILFTYLHLAACEKLTRLLLEKGIRSIAYETIRTPDGQLPCLRPMSEIAGRLSVQEGAKYLENPFGGMGILLGGVPGVKRARVLILGGGVVGTNACMIATGLGAEVTVVDVDLRRLAYLEDLYRGRIHTLFSTESSIAETLKESDLVIGAVLVPGARAPKLVRREHLSTMKNGAVIVDVAVDQGGCFETTHATYHDDPVFIIDGIVHYCVANMPGAVSRTSTYALTNATLKYGLELANSGFENACQERSDLSFGVNTYRGRCTCNGICEAFGIEYTPIDEVL